MVIVEFTWGSLVLAESICPDANDSLKRKSDSHRYCSTEAQLPYLSALRVLCLGRCDEILRLVWRRGNLCGTERSHNERTIVSKADAEPFGTQCRITE